jgi:hypothetical protein
MSANSDDEVDPRLLGLFDRMAEELARPADPEWMEKTLAASTRAYIQWHQRRRLRRRRMVVVIAFATAASLMGIVLFWWERAPSPPYYPGREQNPGELDPEKPSKDAGGVIVWSLPPDAEGSIAVVEVLPDDMVEVRPTRDELCQKVESPRDEADVELTLQFRRHPEGSAVVWMLLTDRPAAQALNECLPMFASARELRAARFPREVLVHLRDRGFQVRAVGRVVLAPIVPPTR